MPRGCKNPERWISSNSVCHPCGHYWDYNPVGLSHGQVCATLWRLGTRRWCPIFKWVAKITWLCTRRGPSAMAAGWPAPLKSRFHSISSSCFHDDHTHLCRISQANICGFSALYSRTLLTTSGVVTFGLLPPIWPGFMLPVRRYLVMKWSFHSLWSRDAIWWHGCGLMLVQVMVCHLLGDKQLPELIHQLET